MTYRSMLVLLDDDPLRAKRVQAAIELAKSFEAHLTGLAPTGLVDLPGTLSVAAQAASTEFSRVARQALAEQAQASAKAFDEACVAAKFSACSSVVAESAPADGLLRQSHGHDVIVLSQPDPESPHYAARLEVVERLVLFSARPTLLLPYAGSFTAPYQNVLVAWDGSRESDRAIADALPFLRKARRVDVIAWQETGLLAGATPTTELDSVRAWLARHGVTADVRSEEPSAPIADAILSRTADLDTDLLVMGGYGHTRWTERLLGGATRGILATMTVPVLMSR
ncbi:universal stress protein [Sphaerotilaceae bacterium SBD11-9]